MIPQRKPLSNQHKLESSWQGEEWKENDLGLGSGNGLSFAGMSRTERQRIAQIQLNRTGELLRCPFRSTEADEIKCNKKGGVCSLRLYMEDSASGQARPASGFSGALRTLCPNRFDEDQIVYRWIGEVVLNDPRPRVLNEISFLEKLPEHNISEDSPGRDDVGRIDNVLVSSGVNGELKWCALEKQAVYFQGSEMGREWRPILEYSENGIPFPAALRRPDYRSSGPKRLMPQLQIKVPSLRRWGKNMAVVVDANFFSALGNMENVNHISNCDIVWFVVKYEEVDGRFRLCPDCVHFTTLERAVEGLTAGRPVSLDTFEERIRQKLQ